VDEIAAAHQAAATPSVLGRFLDLIDDQGIGRSLRRFQL
jgi:hypothetical protein